MRWRDRGFSFRTKSKKNKNRDIPRTKKLRQKDLEKLYTGLNMEIGQKFAYVYVFIFVCLMYSYGLPVFYPIGAAFFMISYMFEKVFVLRYYVKTRDFD